MKHKLGAGIKSARADSEFVDESLWRTRTTRGRVERRYTVCQISTDGLLMPIRTYFKKESDRAYDHASQLRERTKSGLYCVHPPVRG